MHDESTTAELPDQPRSATPLVEAMVEEVTARFETLHVLDPDAPHRCGVLVQFIQTLSKMIRDGTDFADEDAVADFRAALEQALR